jgi:hypothetical protein
VKEENALEIPLFEAVFHGARRLRISPALKSAGARWPMLSEAQPRV